jgi:protein-tyrosine phosphatase
VIDLHTHILPGVDDGVTTMEGALDFARMAAGAGTRTIVATPHYRDGFYMNPRAEVLTAVAELNRSITEAGIPIDVLPGAEIHVCSDLIERVKSGHAPTLADNGRTVLFELSMSQYPVDLENLVFQMRLAGLQVLFAHPERIRYFEEDPKRYEAVLRLGAYGQITTGSVLGVFGEAIEEFSEELVRKGLVHVLASDAHNTRGRPPVRMDAVARIASWVGEARATAMATTIPAAFVAGQDPEVPPPPEPETRSAFSRWFRRR